MVIFVFDDHKLHTNTPAVYNKIQVYAAVISSDRVERTRYVSIIYIDK